MKQSLKTKALSLLLVVLMVLSVMPMSVFAEVAETDVCKIGETGYNTLDLAVAAVQEGQTITLVKDVIFKSYYSSAKGKAGSETAGNHTFNGIKHVGTGMLPCAMTIGGTTQYTLDLNGYWIAMLDSYSSDRLTFNNPNLTVTDSSAGKSGGFYTANVTNGSKSLVLSAGDFTGVTHFELGTNSYSASKEIGAHLTSLARVGKVCSIGMTGYETLAAAATAAVSGNTITMFDEDASTDSVTIPSGVNLVMEDTASFAGGITMSGGNLTIPAGASVAGKIEGSITKLILGDNVKITTDSGLTVGKNKGYTSDYYVTATLGAGAEITGDVTITGMTGSVTNVNIPGIFAMGADSKINGTLTVNNYDNVNVGSGASITSVTFNGGAITIASDATVPAITDTLVTGSNAAGGRFYSNTLAEAFLCAMSGYTLQLQNDTVAADIEKTYADLSSGVTLDLNGHTITGGISVESGADLTIKDTSDGTVGKITNAGNVFTVNSAKLTLESGNFIIESGANNDAAIIYNTVDGKTVINGGNFTLESRALVYDARGTVTINNGTFTSDGGSVFFDDTGTGESVTVNGGDFYAASGSPAFVSTNDTVIVKGGTYYRDVIDYCGMGFTCVESSTTDGRYEIAARTAQNSALSMYHAGEAEPYTFGDSLKNALAEAEEGDEIRLNKDIGMEEGLFVKTPVILNLNTHTIGKTGWVNGEMQLQSDLTIKNGTINCLGGNSDAAIWFYAASTYNNKTEEYTLTLDNATITAEQNTVPLTIAAMGTSGTADTAKLTIVAAEGSTNTIKGDFTAAITMGGSMDQAVGFVRGGHNHLTLAGTGTLNIIGGAETAGIEIVEKDLSGGKVSSASVTITNPNVHIYCEDEEITEDFAINAKHIGDKTNPSTTIGTPNVTLNISAGRFYGELKENSAGLFDGSQLSGGFYHEKPAAKWIVDGYEAVPYSSTAYPELQWEIVKIKQVDAGTATVTDGEDGEKTITIETHGEDKNISATKKGEPTTTVATQEVADIITETLNNDAVSEFDGTNVDNNTNSSLIKEELKKDAQVANDTTAKANIDATTNILKQITVDLTATTVEMQQSGSSVKEINSMTFEVKPIARTTVVDSEGNEKTVEVVIPNELITAPLTFRLFVAPTQAKEAAVYHKGANDTEKKYIGMFPIEKDTTTGKLFVELSAQEFSEYTYETVHIDESSVAIISNGAGDFTGYTTLAAAIEAGAGKTIILMKDITETEAIDFGGKTLEVDLNGHVLTGTAVDAANVTISNNDAENPDCLAVIGVFANNVKAFVADGYDARTPEGDGAVTNSEVFSNNATDVYTVKVVTSTDIDRDETNDEDVKNVDVFARDHIYTEVRIYGARSVAAKVALKYDFANMTINEYPDGWVEEDADGIIRFYDANTDGITYWDLDKTDEEGKAYYLLGSFDFTVDDVEESYLSEHKTSLDANNNPVLKDMFEIVEDTYVAGAWKDGWSSNPANKVEDEKTVDDWANIRLMQMTVNVTPMTGLVYKNANLYLFQNKDMEGVDKDFTATDSNTLQPVEGAEITYAVTAKGAAAPAASAYSAQYPTAKNAGEYTVYYKVTKPGYVTVTGSENVTIAKRDATLTWSATDFNAGSIVKTAENESFWTASDFNTSYDNKVFAAPTAKYVNADGVNTSVPTANITMTTPAGGTLKAVGSYVYTATLDDNYNILNPTCTLLIDGGQIKGYELTNTEEGPSVFVDKQEHDAAKMNKADDATPAKVKYYLSTDDGKTYGDALDEMPKVDQVGKYAVKAVITADGYYDQEQIEKFEIKRVEFFTEKTEYVLGWKLILVYTNEAVPGFTYNGHYMYDVTSLGYKYLEQKDDLGNVIVAGTSYNHVYGILVEGVGDETLVVPSNDSSVIHTIYPVTNSGDVNGTAVPSTLNRNDVNENGTCDINDLVAVQAVYNVDTVRYLNDEMMHIALKADVTGNKMVNMADYQTIKTVSK